MAKMITDTIGLDVSKDKLDVHRLSDGVFIQFENTKKGFKALIKWAAGDNLARVVYEATGPYHRALESACSGHLPLVKVNPLQARRFAQASGTRVKTDKVDARMLALMGVAFDLITDKPLTQNQHDLKELHGARASLVKEQTRILNRQKNQTLQLTRSQGKKQLDQVKKQIAELNEAIEVLLRADPRTSRNIDILKSIPGIGAVSAATVLIEMPEIGTLTRKEAASLTGVAPMTRQSGKWQGKSFIQGGRKTVRDALYMPALVAARRNPDLKAKYDQMVAAGKPPKIALTALMRKLIETGNALIKADRLWLKNVLD
jgi:transposase